MDGGLARRVVVPYEWVREASSTARGSRRIAERLRRRGEGGVEIGEKAINRGDGPRKCRGSA